LPVAIACNRAITDRMNMLIDINPHPSWSSPGP
jgi:hypothetical protein